MSRIGDQRTQSLSRTWTFIWAIFIGSLIVQVVAVVAVVWGLVDVLWQFLTNRNDLDERSTPARLVSATINWWAGQFVYAVTGGGQGRWHAIPRFDMA